jgi:LmbE family N-acetylglucosaminyl deacetylase
MAKTLLAAHAHPDDETITMGGTLTGYGAEGVGTVVVTCTRGDLVNSLDCGPAPMSLHSAIVSWLRPQLGREPRRQARLLRLRFLGCGSSPARSPR